MRTRSPSALTWMLAVLLGTLSLSLSGCTIGVHSGPIPVATSYYSPLYYNGYIVYYDAVGRPIYYANGVQYYVPNTYAYYPRLVRHYRSHRHAYRRWYRSRGRRIRRRRSRRRRRHVRRHKRRTRRRNVRHRTRHPRHRRGSRHRRRR